MDPMTALTLAQLAFKGIGFLKGRTNSRISNASSTTPSYQPGSYPSASTRGSTEREDEREGAEYGTPYTPGAGGSTTPPDTEDKLTDQQKRDRLKWGSVGALEGFRSGYDYGGDVKARNSVKNTFGRIASRYEAKPSSIDAILNDSDFKAFFPNAKKVGFDKIDFGGVKSDFESGDPVGIVDVGNSFDPTTDTGRGWWWGYEDGGTGTSSTSSGSSVKWPTPDVPSPGMRDAEVESPLKTAAYRSSVRALNPEEIWDMPSRTLGSFNRGY